jgi:hypothetical protein
MRFAAIHPFPAELQDMHGAQLSCLIANVNRNPAATPIPFTVTQFTVLGRKRSEAKTLDEADKFIDAFPES